MSTELFGVVYLGIGIALLVWGARLAQLVLGLWGLGIGLWFGELITNNQHFSYAWTFLIIWGLGLLALFLAYSFYKIALSLLVGSAAFWIGAGVLNLWNFDASLVFLLALASGIVAFILTFKSSVSYLILMIISSIIGAAYTITGVLILIDGANVTGIGYGPLNFVLCQESWWIVTLLLLAVVGMSIQDGPRRNQVTDGI